VPPEPLPPVPLLVDDEELLTSRSNRLVPLEVEDVDVELEEEVEELEEEEEELLELDVHTSTPLSNPYEGPTSLVHLRPGRHSSSESQSP